MRLPNEAKLTRIRKNLEKIEPSYLLPEGATKVEKLKYALCERFVIYIRVKKISQVELAKKLNMDTARLNEIVKYKINLFTLDKLIEFTNRLDPKLEIKIA